MPTTRSENKDLNQVGAKHSQELQDLVRSAQDLRWTYNNHRACKVARQRFLAAYFQTLERIQQLQELCLTPQWEDSPAGIDLTHTIEWAQGRCERLRLGVRIPKSPVRDRPKEKKVTIMEPLHVEETELSQDPEYSPEDTGHGESDDSSDTSSDSSPEEPSQTPCSQDQTDDSVISLPVGTATPTPQPHRTSPPLNSTPIPSEISAPLPEVEVNALMDSLVSPSELALEVALRNQAENPPDTETPEWRRDPPLTPGRKSKPFTGPYLPRNKGPPPPVPGFSLSLDHWNKAPSRASAPW